jgi:cysteine desulfurase/selenocysteine lyase
MFDPKQIRTQFPFFSNHPSLAYLDNAATTQKPAAVIQAITDFYEKENTNVHRGIYQIAAQTSQKYEAVRQKVATFLHAAKPENIIYTSGTTASINLVAQSFLAPRLQAGDEVVISALEHHANLIPWQQVCKKKGAQLRVIQMEKNGELDFQFFQKKLSQKTKLVAITHISNTLGTINTIADIIDISHKKNIPVLVDGAQSAAHYAMDVQALDVDFFVFSGHKIYGPTGIGILYGKEEHLAAMPPYQFGGDAIRDVRFEETIFAPPPQRFEPGTTNIAGVFGLGAAVDFLEKTDRQAVQSHLRNLTETATEQLKTIDGLHIIGEAKQKSAIVSFSLKNVHPHDVATFLGAENIAVRAGHHCTQPIMDFYGIPGTTRVSFAMYNTEEEVERLVAAVREVAAFFG